MKRTKRSDLECIEINNSTNKKRALVILHGYGASYDDLAPIGNFLQTDADWFFLNGPLEINLGPFMTGRAWFPIDMIALERAVATNDFSSYFGKGYPDGFLEASAKVIEVVKGLKDSYEEIVIGGFSQGAMISTHVALSDQDLAKKLIVFSGTYVAEVEWAELLKEGLKFKTFQSHGLQDPVLPLSEAQRLSNLFKQFNSEHIYHEFSGGHEIPPNILYEAQKFIES